VLASVVLLLLVGWLACTAVMALLPGPAVREARKQTVAQDRQAMGVAQPHHSLPPTGLSEVK
jgi:hypothetical protein